MADSKQQQTDMSPAEVADRVWELMEKINIAMFTTWAGDEQHSRPLGARVRRDENAVYFLVDAEGHKNIELEKYPQVSCTFADNANHNYVAMAGIASLSNDRAKIEELWTDFDKAWWDDKTDPSIRLLTVRPDGAELWDGPNGLLTGAKMALAAITGAKPPMGDNATVKL